MLRDEVRVVARVRVRVWVGVIGFKLG